MYTGPLDTEVVESMNECDPEVCTCTVSNPLQKNPNTCKIKQKIKKFNLLISSACV